MCLVGFCIIQVFVQTRFLHGSRMTKDSKTPPEWTSDMSYEIWKPEIVIWDAATTISDSRKAPTVALSLTGAKREIARNIPLEELKANDGLQKLLDKLKTGFGQNEDDKLFFDYLQFGRFSRGTKSISDFITEFETLHNRLKKHKVELPDVLLACKLLSAGQFDDKDTKLILSATSKLSFGNVKASVRRIFA